MPSLGTVLLLVLAAAAPIGPLKVKLASTVILANPGDAGKVVIAAPLETMWATGLAVEDVAILSADLIVAAGGLRQDFVSGDILFRAELQGSLPGLTGTGRLFCGERFRKNVPEINGVLNVIIAPEHRFTSERRLCLVDDTGDGTFDRAIAIGAKDASAPASPVPAVRYSEHRDFPLPGAQMRFRPIKGGALQGPQIELDAYFGEAKLNSAATWMPDTAGGKAHRVFSERSIKQATYPHAIAFGGIEITLQAYDEATRTVTARLDKPFYRTLASFEAIGPNTIYIYH